MATFDVEYDLVVVGGGGSGKMAAYIGAKEGGLATALLEKAPETGGSSVFAEGQAAFESSEQLARKTPPTPGMHYPSRAEGYKRYIDYSHKRANPDVVRMQVTHTAETIDIMKSLGIVYTDVTIYAYEQPTELNSFHRPDGLGAHMQEVLLQATVDAGVDIFTSTPAKQLIVEDGKVVGVIAEDADGKTIRIGAKAVVLAGGGFGGNLDMVRAHSRFARNADALIYMGPEPNTGDTINMALAIGADTWEMQPLMLVPVAKDKSLVAHINGGGSQPVLWVNKTGQRYYDEHVALSFADAANVIAIQPGGASYSIMDQATVQHLIDDGSDIGLGDFVKYHLPLTGLQTELDEAVAEGDMAWKADSIPELAEAIGLDPEVFTATVALYNEFAEDGDDPLFYKDAKYLRPVKTAPFYAIEMRAAILVSVGALRVNGDLQVIGVDAKPIEGLYAVGMDAGGLFGDTYNLDVPGTANGFAHASGRVAARHAIGAIKAAAV
ncbi:MAG: FAD-dependent oxidoreductase [Bifidobacteriaceae bacterium]|jgi:fumarate reductase flavoprotein subunit|nr:FAD-dependent oxidoreductase [Bifidobacteriaceae bacterium]